MVDEIKLAFDNISRILAIIRYDIEHHQVINDLSLNIHGENYFRDIFNFVYDRNFENANFDTQNAACIDLIDTSKKELYQITTTRTKEKIEKTLAVLTKPEYYNYNIKIFYLLDKANPDKNTISKIEKKFNINLLNSLCDYTDLIRHIKNLEKNKIIQLDKKYFSKVG